MSTPHGGRPISWAHRDRRDAELATAVRESLAAVNEAYAEFTKQTTPALRKLSAAYTDMAARSRELQEFRQVTRALLEAEDDGVH